MASTMARTSCSEALTSGRSGRTTGVSDEVLMQFLRLRIYRSAWAGERQQEAPQQNSLWGLVFTQSGRRDLNATAPCGAVVLSALTCCKGPHWHAWVAMDG